MAEWDELDARLKDLGQATTDRLSEPLAVADIRALGVRRAQRRHLALAAVAAVVVLLGGAGVYALGVPPQQHEPSPAAPVTTTASPTEPTPAEPTPSEALGYGKKVKKKPSVPTRGGGSYPTSSPTYAPDTPAPSTSEPPETPEPSVTESEPAETSEPEPTETEGPAPDRTVAPTSKPTDGGGGQPAPKPTDGSSTK